MLDKAKKGEVCRICEQEFEEGSEIIRHNDDRFVVPISYTIHVTPKECGTEHGMSMSCTGNIQKPYYI